MTEERPTGVEAVKRKQLLYVYVDWTQEPAPRPFYVGKGTRGRLLSLHRSDLHDQYIREYGVHRIAVFESVDVDDVNGCERFLIKHYHTEAAKGWGANKNPGGAGQRPGVPKTPEHRHKLSLANIGKHDHSGEKHPSWGKKRSDEQRANISLSLKGLMTGERNPRWKADVSKSTRSKISAALKASSHRGEKISNSKLTEVQVIEIKLRSGSFSSVRAAAVALAPEFKVSIGSITGILTGRTWRHVCVPSSIMDTEFVIPVPHKRSELETTRALLRQQKQDTSYINTMLADVDAGRAQCLPEDGDGAEHSNVVGLVKSLSMEPCSCYHGMGSFTGTINTLTGQTEYKTDLGPKTECLRCRARRALEADGVPYEKVDHLTLRVML